jgi:putative membrane protein
VINETKGIFKYTSQQLRLLNEVATVFLIAIVMLVTVKDSMSLLWGLVGLIILIAVLMIAIKVYKRMRERK